MWFCLFCIYKFGKLVCIMLGCSDLLFQMTDALFARIDAAQWTEEEKNNIKSWILPMAADKVKALCSQTDVQLQCLYKKSVTPPGILCSTHLNFL